jgi:hypothetical protein
VSRRRAILPLGAAVLLGLGCAGAPPRPPQLAPLGRGDGAVLDVPAALPAGYVAIVDFWSASCGACAIVGAQVEAAIAGEPRVLLRKVDVGDGFTPIARAYQVAALPHFDVYDRARRLRYVLVGNDCLRAPEIARALLAEP